MFWVLTASRTLWRNEMPPSSRWKNPEDHHFSTVLKASKLTNWKVATHIVEPAEFPPGRICLHVALKINVITFLDVIWIKGASQHQRDDWWNWGRKDNDYSLGEFGYYTYRVSKVRSWNATTCFDASTRVPQVYPFFFLAFFPSFLSN